MVENEFQMRSRIFMYILFHGLEKVTRGERNIFSNHH